MLMISSSPHTQTLPLPLSKKKKLYLYENELIDFIDEVTMPRCYHYKNSTIIIPIINTEEYDSNLYGQISPH